MNHRLTYFLAAFSLSAIIFVLLSVWRRPSRLLILLTGVSLIASGQSWSPFLDSSRAVDWTSAGFTIPNYTINCATQPSLTTGSGAAAANAAAIQNALNSCDAAHNVVNLPAGTYYIAGFSLGQQGHQVVRGAGPNSTYIYVTSQTGCGAWAEGICLGSNSSSYHGSALVQPPSGSNQCSWTGGYAKGSTTITLSNCGGTPPANGLLILDQRNDTSDTNGIFICDDTMDGCTNKGLGAGNQDGRIINGVTHSQSQSTFVTGVTSRGGGSYTVTISPGVYFNNIRSSQSPGGWWAGIVQNDGIEDLTLDHSISDTPIGLVNCYQCWVKNVRSVYGGRNHIHTYASFQSVIRDSYFYQSQGHSSGSYGIETETGTSGLLIENNIFQQLTAPIMFGQGTGSVVGYNFTIDNQWGGVFAQNSFSSHNAGSEMNLWEGNSLLAINADSSTWGSSANGTYFRNMLIGWQSGKTNAMVPVYIGSWSRAFNVVGNVLGQTGWSNNYESYATSTTGGVNGGTTVETSIYGLGWTGINGEGTCDGPPSCGPLVRTTLMRWGNWDVVTKGTKWDSTEASPGAVPYANANFTSSYFTSLGHTLPTSLYLSSRPSWWGTQPWPSIGPDVSSGNLGVCSTGTYAGAQATSASQCSGSTLTGGWANHANSIPAQDCFLNVMGGPPDGSGNLLSFDANQCYSSSSTTSGTPGPPAGLTATVN